MMNRIVCVVGLAAVLGVSGCGKKEAVAPAAEPAKPKTGATMPALATPAEAPPPIPVPAAPAAVAPPTGVTAVSATAALDNGLVRTVDEEGKVLTAERILYRAIELYVEGQGKPWPKDPKELVQARVLQAIPPAPAGRKWAIDEKQHKVVLVPQ